MVNVNWDKNRYEEDPDTVVFLGGDQREGDEPGIVFLQGSGVSRDYYESVGGCIEDVLDTVDSSLEVRDLRYSERSPYDISPEEMVEEALLEERRQVDGRELNDLMQSRFKGADTKSFGVFVTDKDMTIEGKYNFILGATMPGYVSSLSTYRFRNFDGLDPFMKRESFKSVVYHELGHLFGATDEFRRDDLVDRLGKHCGNKDVMRQGVNVSEWVDYTEDRLETGMVYCSSCEDAMVEYLSGL